MGTTRGALRLRKGGGVPCVEASTESRVRYFGLLRRKGLDKSKERGGEI